MLSLFQFIFCYYRPQTKFAKVMFLHLSVSHSVHRGVPGQVHPPGRYTPYGQVHPSGQAHPQAGTPPDRYPPTPGRYPPEQCTLGAGGMEYILVEYWFPKKNQ